MRTGRSGDRDSAPHANTATCPRQRTTKGLTMTATAQDIADTLNRAFDEPSMTMPILHADVIPALAEFDQDATTAADPDDYRDRIVLRDGSIILYDSRTERWAVSSAEEVAASDQRRLASGQSA
jgi:hypothetical protein